MTHKKLQKLIPNVKVELTSEDLVLDNDRNDLQMEMTKKSSKSDTSTSIFESSKVIPVSGKWTIAWRVITGIVFVFFMLSAFVQINDPDPWIWIPIYVIPALLTVSATIKTNISENHVWRIICHIHLVLCMLGSVYVIAQVIGLLKQEMVNPLVHEEGRELAGLFIVIIWLLTIRSTKIDGFDPSTDNIAATMILTSVLAIVPLIVWATCFTENGPQRFGHCKDMFAEFKSNIANEKPF